MFVFVIPFDVKSTCRREGAKVIIMISYLEILAQGATLVPKASFWHRSRVSCHAHKAHSLCISVTRPGIAGTAVQWWQDNRSRIRDHGAKRVWNESSCSSN